MYIYFHTSHTVNYEFFDGFERVIRPFCKVLARWEPIHVDCVDHLNLDGVV